MQRHVAGAVIGAALTGVALSAQTQQDLLPPTANRFIMLGCGGRETATPSGRGGPGTPAKFFITDTRGDAPTVYRLEGGDVAELTFHVGHSVEITGSLSGPAANATGPNAKA